MYKVAVVPLQIRSDLLLGVSEVGMGFGAGPRARASNRPRLVFLTRGCSSVGRAPDLHSGGRRFDPDQLHQRRKPAGPVAQLARAHP